MTMSMSLASIDHFKVPYYGHWCVLLQVHHFIPLEPWTCNKIKGRRRQMKIDGTNDGPQSKFEKKEQIKLVLDMSNDGPMFKEKILLISNSYLTSDPILLMFEMVRSSV